MESIMQSKDDKRCYIHLIYLNQEVPGTEVHHCLHGTANRRLAEEDGLKVRLCPFCHRMLHDKGHHDKDLQKVAQMKWMQKNNRTVEDFIKRYGKNYL